MTSSSASWGQPRTLAHGVSTLHSDACGDDGGTIDPHRGEEESPRRLPPGSSPCPTANRTPARDSRGSVSSRLTVVRGWRSGTRWAARCWLFGQPIAGRFVVSRWLPVSIFRLSESLKRYFASGGHIRHQTGCKPDTAEPPLCYKVNNPRRRS